MPKKTKIEREPTYRGTVPEWIALAKETRDVLAKEAIKHIRRGKYAEAIRDLAEALEKDSIAYGLQHGANKEKRDTKRT